MDLENVWQYHQLCQTGPDEREDHAALNRLFSLYAIVVKAKRLFTVSKAGFNFPSWT